MAANVRKLIYWNGKDLPPGMSSLPVGLYAIESRDESALTPDNLSEIEAAAAAIERGEGVSFEDVDRDLQLLIAAATNHR